MINVSYNAPAFKGNFIVEGKDAERAAEFFKSVQSPTEGPFPLVTEKTGWVYFTSPSPEDWVNDVGLNRHKIPHIFVNDERLQKLKSGIQNIVKNIKTPRQ